MKTDRSAASYRWLLLAPLCVSASACAGECVPQVRDGWIRMLPGAMPMMAGFGRIENRCPTPAAIVDARSAAFADTSLHETTVVEGVSRMRAVPELRIAPNGAAVLQPGGLHLMLMQPTTPLKAGGKVTIELQLQDGRRIRGDFALRAAGG
jgi:periplasmic copper chaperone A